MLKNNALIAVAQSFYSILTINYGTSVCMNALKQSHFKIFTFSGSRHTIFIKKDLGLL